MTLMMVLVYMKLNEQFLALTVSTWSWSTTQCIYCNRRQIAVFLWASDLVEINRTVVGRHLTVFKKPLCITVLISL